MGFFDWLYGDTRRMSKSHFLDRKAGKSSAEQNADRAAAEVAETNFFAGSPDADYLWDLFLGEMQYPERWQKSYKNNIISYSHNNMPFSLRYHKYTIHSRIYADGICIGTISVGDQKVKSFVDACDRHKHQIEQDKKLAAIAKLAKELKSRAD